MIHETNIIFTILDQLTRSRQYSRRVRLLDKKKISIDQNFHVFQIKSRDAKRGQEKINNLRSKKYKLHRFSASIKYVNIG